MTRNINLDAKRAARAEARKAQGDEYENPTITLGGITYTLPDEMPVDFAELVAAGQFRDGFRHLFADDDAGEEAFNGFMSNDLTVDDMRAFSDELADLYGVGDSGNSSASGSSSRKTGKR